VPEVRMYSYKHGLLCEGCAQLVMLRLQAQGYGEPPCQIPKCGLKRSIGDRMPRSTSCSVLGASVGLWGTEESFPA
jgi:hypothetical protein